MTMSGYLPSQKQMLGLKNIRHVALLFVAATIGFVVANFSVARKHYYVGADMAALLLVDTVYFLDGELKAESSVNLSRIEVILGNQLNAFIGTYPEHPLMPYLVFRIRTAYSRAHRPIPSHTERALINARIPPSSIAPEMRFYSH